MRSTTNMSIRRLVVTAVLLAVTTVAAGCGTEGGGGNAAATGKAANDKVAQRATDAVEKLYGNGTFTDPPSTGPKAQPRHKIALVNSGVQSPTGSAVARGAEDAAKAIGWDLSIYDGKYEPSEYQEGIRQAIAQHVDVIWLYSIDCPLVRTALDEAKAAGIPVVGQEAADCSDVDPKAPSYFARSLQFSEGDFIAWGEGLGASQATWLLSKLGADANIIEISNTELVITKAVHDGFTKAMKTQCPDCKVTTMNIRIADFGPALQQKTATALLRNPDANGMAVSYDDLMTSGVAAAVMASGHNDSLAVVSGSGYAANVDLVRNNKGEDAGWTYDGAFEAWASIDMINRFFAGADSAPSGVGISMFDKDHDLPPAGEAWKTSIDYVSGFKKVWGVS